MAKNLDPNVTSPTSIPPENNTSENVATEPVFPETVVLDSVDAPVSDVTPEPVSDITPEPVSDDGAEKDQSEKTPKPPASGRVPRSLERFLTPDESEAMHTLDDTVVRPLPDPVAIWERIETEQREQEPTIAPRKLSTWALVAVVAVVSFVAGGLTARLSSQVPVLFSQKEPVTEVVASYKEPATEEQEEPEEPAVTTSSTPEPERNTGYDTTDDAYPQERQDDGSQDVSWQDQDDTDDQDTTLTWDIDNTGDRSLSYDYENDRVTLDYDGSSMTLDLDGLLNGTAPDDETSSIDEYSYIPDGGTGYDSEEQRDWYEWGSPRDVTTRSPWSDEYHS